MPRRGLRLSTMSNPTDPKSDPREGLWDPERTPELQKRRKRALPKSRVSPTLWAMIALVFIAALCGIFF